MVRQNRIESGSSASPPSAMVAEHTSTKAVYRATMNERKCAIMSAEKCRWQKHPMRGSKIHMMIACILLMCIAIPSAAFARQVFSPFDHTISGLRDQYQFRGMWDQQGVNWFRANQWPAVSPNGWRLWWESETRSPSPSTQPMVGSGTAFYHSVVGNSIVSSSFPHHRIEAAADEISHQTRRPDLLVPYQFATAIVLMNPGNITSLTATFESEVTDWWAVIPVGAPPTIIDFLGQRLLPATHRWIR